MPTRSVAQPPASSSFRPAVGSCAQVFAEHLVLYERFRALPRVQAYTFAAIESALGRRAAAAADSAGLQPLVAHAEPATIPLPLLVAEISPAANADFGATSVFLLPAPAASPSTLRPTYERAYMRLHTLTHTHTHTHTHSHTH